MGVAVAEAPAPARPGVLRPLRLAVAARLVAKRGHADLFRALRVALDLGAAVHLEVFGDGPLRPELEALAAELRLEERIAWRGVVSHGDLLGELRSGRYDAGVLPSVTAEDGDKEGVPVFLIECMGAGLPVVSTPNGGIPELLGGGCGVLTPERDVSALGAALFALTQDGAQAAFGKARSRRRSADVRRAGDPLRLARAAGEDRPAGRVGLRRAVAAHLLCRLGLPGLAQAGVAQPGTDGAVPGVRRRRRPEQPGLPVRLLGGQPTVGAPALRALLARAEDQSSDLSQRP